MEETIKALGAKAGRLDRQTSLLGKMSLAKNLKPHEQAAALKKLKAEILKNKMAANTQVQRQELNPSQVKYAKLGEQLDELSDSLQKETVFVNHLKKLD